MLDTLVNHADVAVPVLVAMCGCVVSGLVAVVAFVVRHFLRDMALTLQRIEARIQAVADTMERKYVTKEMCEAHRRGMVMAHEHQASAPGTIPAPPTRRKPVPSTN